MDINELRIGSWVLTPKGSKQIEELSLKNDLLNWKDYGCTIEEIKPIPLNKSVLEKMGWERKGKMLFLKTTPRLGWNSETGLFIFGYTELPKKVLYLHQLQYIMQLTIKGTI